MFSPIFPSVSHSVHRGIPLLRALAPSLYRIPTSPTRTYSNLFINVRNSSCGKVMFLQVSVCLQVGRCTLPLGRHPPGQTPPLPGQTPPGRHPETRRPLQQTVRILLECILVMKHVRPASRQLASYWKDFLMILPPLNSKFEFSKSPVVSDVSFLLAFAQCECTLKSYRHSAKKITVCCSCMWRIEITQNPFMSDASFALICVSANES